MKITQKEPIEVLVNELKTELPDYKILNGTYGYWPAEEDIKYITSRVHPMSRIGCGEIIVIKEKKLWFPKELVTIINISPNSYQRFLSGKNILYGESRPFIEIFPKPTMLCLIEQAGKPAYAIANKVLQSQNYDFEKLDVTTHN